MENPQSNGYLGSGFNGFLNRSIGSTLAATLGQFASSFKKQNNQQVNYDHSQQTGALGDSIRVGTVLIDGVAGRISIYDSGGLNEVGRIGNLDG